MDLVGKAQSKSGVGKIRILAPIIVKTITLKSPKTSVFTSTKLGVKFNNSNLSAKQNVILQNFEKVQSFSKVASQMVCVTPGKNDGYHLLLILH